MGLILRTEGCTRVHSELEPYKAPDVSTIPCDSFEKICQDLAEGTPFVGTYLAGKRRSSLPYCKIYKSPSLAAIEAKKVTRIGHVVVIIGAGMKKGKKFFYFLNSWGKKFCPRKNRNGETITGGIGKLRAKDLTKNLVKLSPPNETGGERSLQYQSNYNINPVNHILMMATEKQYSAQLLKGLREKTNSEFVPPEYVDDGIFRDDEGVCPKTCCAKNQALKVIKKFIDHFPIKRAPLRVQFTAPKLNFTGLMEKVCKIEPSVLHSCEERLKDVQGRLEVRSVSVHAEGGPCVEQHDIVEVPQAASAKEPDAVAQISEIMQKEGISTESQGSSQGKQQRRCKELNFTGLMEKVAEPNASVTSKDESGTQHSIVCEIEPSILHSCEERTKDVQGRVEVWSVSVHADGGPSVEQHEIVEVPQAASAKDPDAVAQISETMQKQSISIESQGSAHGKQQRRCKECDVLMEDKLYRELCKSWWHKHYTCHKNGLPPLSQEECMVEMELVGSNDLKDYNL